MNILRKLFISKNLITVTNEIMIFCIELSKAERPILVMIVLTERLGEKIRFKVQEE